MVSVSALLEYLEMANLMPQCFRCANYSCLVSIFFTMNLVLAKDSLATDCFSELNGESQVVCGSFATNRLSATLSSLAQQKGFELIQGPSEALTDCVRDLSCLIEAYEQKIFLYSPPISPCSSDYKTYFASVFPGKSDDVNACKSGDGYSGEWRDNKRNGLGEQVYANGNIVVGFWENNELNGEVKIKYSSGKTFYGTVNNGNYHGPATILDGGLVYVGSFVEDKESQIFRGTQYFFDGTSIFNDFYNLLESLDDSFSKSDSPTEYADLAPEQDHNDSNLSDLAMLLFLFLFF